MGSDHVIEPKGKVQPKPAQETAEPEKTQSPMTKPDVQGKLDPQTLRRMQQTVGNAAVQRFLAQRQQSGPTDINDDTAEAIQSKKGSGSKLDDGIAQKAGGAMGQDFSNVNVHTDSESDTLNRQLGAKAFTTGNDIFFQSGAYDPGSSDGQRLISHELTHVVQQGGSGAPIQGKMSVNDPNDSYEAEADKVADMVMNAPDEAVAQRADAPEDELMEKPDPTLQRAAPEEEVMPKPDPTLQRASAPEDEVMEKQDPALQRMDEEEMGLKPDPTLQRQEEEEPEPPLARKQDPSLQRVEEEEMPVQPKLDPSLQREELPEEEMNLKPDPNLQRQEEREDEGV